MLGRYFKIQRGNNAPAPCLPKCSGLNPLPLHASASRGAMSGRSMGTRPVPMITPSRSGSIRLRSRPLSVIAMPEAATPNFAARPMILMLLRCSWGM